MGSPPGSVKEFTKGIQPEPSSGVKKKWEVVRPERAIRLDRFAVSAVVLARAGAEGGVGSRTLTSKDYS
jgi:hypothetical protein